MAARNVLDELDLQKPPQFQLRTLFLLTACLAVLFAVMGTIGPIASAALLFLLAMIGLHVAGNALGTTLRDQSTDKIRWQATEPAEVPAQLRLWTAMTPRLGEHTRPGWTIRGASLLGALVCGALGSLVLGQLADVSPMGVAVGTISFAVLGAFFGFLIGSFLEMLLSAWKQAVCDANLTEGRTSIASYGLPASGPVRGDIEGTGGRH